MDLPVPVGYLPHFEGELGYGTPHDTGGKQVLTHYRILQLTNVRTDQTSCIGQCQIVKLTRDDDARCA